MSSSQMDTGYYARLRLAVPILATGGVLLPLMALAVNWGGNWALNAGLLLAGLECLLASYLIRRSNRRGRDLPAKSRRLIFALSSVVIALMIIALFV